MQRSTYYAIIVSLEARALENILYVADKSYFPR